MPRKPLAIANWKMAMTVAEGLTFVRDFQGMAGGLLDTIEVVICPPFTTLWPLAQELRTGRLHLGGQNIAATTDIARTGEISAALLADAGCRWVMLGHWEVRRHLGDDDTTVNRKVHLACAAGLAPIVLLGEARDSNIPQSAALEQQLTRVLAGCAADQVAQMACVYEPESRVGGAAPAAPEHVATGCTYIRGWVRARWGAAVADSLRIVYGGSVAPEHAAGLLSSPDLDGLGASTRGRDAATFVEIVRQIGRMM